MKVNNTVAGDLKDNAPKLCGDVTSDILFPWNKAVNMFAFGNGLEIFILQ